MINSAPPSQLGYWFLYHNHWPTWTCDVQHSSLGRSFNYAPPSGSRWEWYYGIGYCNTCICVVTSTIWIFPPICLVNWYQCPMRGQSVRLTGLSLECQKILQDGCRFRGEGWTIGNCYRMDRGVWTRWRGKILWKVACWRERRGIQENPCKIFGW